MNDWYFAIWILWTNWVKIHSTSYQLFLRLKRRREDKGSFNDWAPVRNTFFSLSHSHTHTHTNKHTHTHTHSLSLSIIFKLKMMKKWVGGRGYGLTKCSNVPSPFLGKSERSWNLQLDYQKNDKNIKNLVALEVSKILRHTQACIHTPVSGKMFGMCLVDARTFVPKTECFKCDIQVSKEN